MQKLISLFLSKIISEDGLSQNTRQAYFFDLTNLAEFFTQKNLDVKQITTQHLTDYLQQNSELQNSSLQRKISCFKSFFQFLFSEKILDYNPSLDLEAPKSHKNLPHFLTRNEINTMLDYLYQHESEFNLKFATMLEIMYSAGLRVSELVSLSFANLQFNGDKLLDYLIVKGKGNKERIAPLNSACLHILPKYLQYRKRYPNKEWLFLGNIRTSKKNLVSSNNLAINKNKHLTRQGFFVAIKKIALACGIDKNKVYPHAIRHSFATHLLENGLDLRILQELLGHSNINTTEIYTAVGDAKLKKTIFQHHPLKDFK